MPAWWTPDFTYWLLPAALIGVPVIAGGIFALAQVVADGLLALGQRARPEENAARGIAAGSIAYRVMAVFLVLAGIIEWAIGGSQALLARSLIADYPAEFWRWFNAVLLPVLVASLCCGLGAFTCRRVRMQPKSS